MSNSIGNVTAIFRAMPDTNFKSLLLEMLKIPKFY